MNAEPTTKPTTAEEREQRLAWIKRMDAKAVIVDRAFERRLIAQVEALEADIATQVAFACPHIDKHELEKRIAEAEAENKRLRVGRARQEDTHDHAPSFPAHEHPDGEPPPRILDSSQSP